MSPTGASSAAGNRRTWADIAFLLFGGRRSRKVAVHCHVNSPKQAEPHSGRAGPYFDPPAKPTAAAALEDLDGMFCFTGRRGGALRSNTKFSSDGGGGGDGGGAFVAPPKKDAVYNDTKHGAPAEVAGKLTSTAGGAVESVFCTTCPVRASTDEANFGGSRARANGGAAGRDREKNKLPLGEIRNGSRSGSAAALQQEKQQRLQQQWKPSGRRKSSGSGAHAPPVSGRVAVVPRRSVDSAARPAPSPPTGSAPARHKQLLPQLSSSGSSFASLMSLTSDVDGGTHPNSRGTLSLGSSTTRRTSAGRRRRPVILAADMPEKLQQDALECTARAIDGSSDHEDIAALIKKDFDELHGAKWHCIVGRHFGSFVTAESNHFVHLYLGKVAVLLFKAGA